MIRVLVLVGVVLAAALGFFIALLSPVQTRDPYTVSFIVLPGESLHDIASDLQSMGLIRERHAFVVMARMRGRAREVKAGPYQGLSNEWAWTILGKMVEGDVRDTSVTVPEGLWVTEVAERLAPWTEGGSAAFLQAARDSLLIERMGIAGDSLEGYLFPETYRLHFLNPPSEIVSQMTGMFQAIWRRELEARAVQRRISRHDVVTLASIVEAEAHVPAERPRIAAVYLNRLALGLPLQADPTVHYALGQRRPRTLLEDLKVRSPYNTYLVPGLPPGPICNPGLDALRAVLWPMENCRDLYFVAQGDGTHLFAPDFEGHQRNRGKIRTAQGGGSR